MHDMSNERKSVILFSTKDIGTQSNLFRNTSLREWFRSPELCDFFLSNKQYINPNVKVDIFTEMQIQSSNIESKQKEFLEKYKLEIDITKKNFIKLKIKQLGDEAQKEFEELWNSSVSEADIFAKKLQEKKFVNNSPHKVDGRSYQERFSVYTLQNNDCWVYAVNSLSEKTNDPDNWYRVLCHEIVERHKDCEKLDIYLVLHDKDVFDKTTFKVVKTNETYEKTDKTDIKFNVIVFQHQVGEDPIADILNNPALSQEKVIQEICNIAKLGPLCRLSDEMSTYTPNAVEFEEKRKNFDNLKDAKIDNWETIKLIDDELKSILKIKNDE